MQRLRHGDLASNETLKLAKLTASDVAETIFCTKKMF